MKKESNICELENNSFDILYLFAYNSNNVNDIYVCISLKISENEMGSKTIISYLSPEWNGSVKNHSPLFHPPYTNKFYTNFCSPYQNFVIGWKLGVKNLNNIILRFKCCRGNELGTVSCWYFNDHQCRIAIISL